MTGLASRQAWTHEHIARCTCGGWHVWTDTELAALHAGLDLCDHLDPPPRHRPHQEHRMSRPTNQIQIDGRLADDATLRFTQSGHAVASFRIGHTPRRKQGEEWVDGETVWLGCSLWRDDAEAFAEVGRKGDLVLVTGQLESRSWDDKSTGQQRTAIEVQANTATVLRKRGVQRTSQPAGRAAPASDDPWQQSTGPGGWGVSNDDSIPF